MPTMSRAPPCDLLAAAHSVVIRAKSANVEGDHDPALFGGEREQSFVVPAVEFASLVGGAGIVLLAQGSRDQAR
jgi:hypothetical protein